jgi:hypothetical protein
MYSRPTHDNYIRDEINSRLNSENDAYVSYLIVSSI